MSLGWLIAWPVLTHIAPSFPSMRPNTALAFVLTGAALYLLVDERAARARLRAGRACAAVGLGLSALTLSQYLFAVELPLAHWPTPASRMAPNTALAFVLLNGALAVWDDRRRWVRACGQACTLFSFALAFMAIVGHGYGVRELYGLSGYSSMAVHTAAGLLVLSGGVLAARIAQGPLAMLADTGPAGVANRRFLPFILVVPFVIGWFRLRGQQLGWYETEFGLALMVTLSTFLLAGVWLWNAHAQERMQAEREHAQRDERFLLELGELLRTSREPEHALQQVTQRLGEYLGASRCAFSEIDELADRSITRGDYARGLPPLAGERKLSASSADVLALLRAGQLLVSADARSDPRTAADYATAYGPLGLCARIAVPLLRAGQWVGLLLVSTGEPRAWTQREINLVESAAEKAWVWFEHLRMLEALAEREQDLLVTMRSIGDGLLTTDGHGRVRTLNPVAERLTGWSASDARGKPLSEVFRIIHEDTRAELESPAARVLREGAVVGLANHTLLLARDGSERPISDSAAPMLAADGGLRGVVLVFRDATAERAAEEARRLSERMRERGRFFELSLDLVCIASSKGYFLELNPAFSRTLGYASGELVARPILDFVHPDDVRPTLHEFGRMTQGESTLGFTNRYRCKDGSYRWLQWRAARDEGGLMYATARDITEDLRKAEALRESEERWRILIEGARDYAIFMLDARGHVSSWNAGAERIMGFRAAEIVGRHIAAFLTSDDPARSHPERELTKALEHGRCEEEGWRVRKDGSRFWANVVLAPLRDDQGQLRGYVKVMRDFTERQKARAQLEAREASLEASLKDRELLLQEVHHRVKNNLQIIASLVSMQIRVVSDGPSRIALEECKTRVQAIALIHEQLYQSRDFASIPFSTYVRSLAANVFHAMGVSPASIRLELQIDPVSLTVDKAIPCGLILNELITNALKHAFPNERRGSLRVALRGGAEAVSLSVSDDGVGIAEDFDLERSKSLGMQLVATLVDQLDGRLSIARAGGTAFDVTFPAKSAA